MKYKFIGENNSLGFITGQIYDLELYHGYNCLIACSRYVQCPYTNYDTFYKNWEKIREVKNEQYRKTI